jgi:hypothetical protein
MSEPKEVGTYTISKGHLIELSGLSRDGNDITYDVKSMRAELADGDFVEFGILPTGDGASLRILVFGSDGFIRDNQRIDGSQTTYRYTHSGGGETLVFDLQPVGTLGAEVAFRAGHTVPVPASNQTVSKSNSQNSIKTEPKQDIEFTAVARDPNGGWVGLTFIPEGFTDSDQNANYIEVPVELFQNLLASYGEPITVGDYAHRAISEALVKWANDVEFGFVDLTASFNDVSTQALTGVNDPEADKQDYLDSSNLDFQTAWTTSTGVGAKVCVIDTGGDFNHEDMVGRLASQWNVVNDSTELDTNQSRFHGLSVASVVGAGTNNNTGMAGAAFGAELHFVQAVGLLGEHIYEAIERCIDVVQADVINMSFVSGSSSQSTARSYPASIVAKLESFIDNGGFVVQGAGNDNEARHDMPITRKAGYLTVGAVTAAGVATNYTARGPAVDLSTFGGAATSDVNDRILTAHNGDTYVARSGTSYSAPLVASLVALMKEEYPTMNGREFERALHEGLFNDEPQVGGLGATALKVDTAVGVAASMAATPFRLTADQYQYRHSGTGDFVVTVHLDNASTATEQLTVATTGDTLEFVQVENITASTFDARFRPKAELALDFGTNEITFTLPDDSLTMDVLHSGAIADISNSAASYVGVLKLVGVNGSNNNQSVLKVFDYDDVKSGELTKVTFTNVDADEAITSVFVAIDLNNNGTFCESFEYCSATASVNGDIATLRFTVGNR